MKRLFEVSVLFMALTLGAFLYRESYAAAVMFIASTSLFAFVSYLERKQRAEIDELRDAVKDCVQKVNSLSVALNWNRS